MKYVFALTSLFLLGATARVHADPSIALHAAEVAQREACTTFAPSNLPCSQFNISALTKHGYNVYIVAAEVDTTLDAASFGIEYNGDDGQGVDVFGNAWCSLGLLFPSPAPSGFDFPASGSGVVVTFSPPCPDTTRSGLNAVLGYFYVYAYAADVMAVIKNPRRNSDPDLAIKYCDQAIVNFPADPRAAIRFSDAGDVLGYNPCTGEGTPAPPPGQNPPPPPPLPIPDQNAGLYFHIAGDEGTPRCGVTPTTIADVVTSAPAPSDSTEYVVYLLASPKVASGYMQQFRGARFGIQYDLAQPDRGLDIVDWTSCCFLNFPADDWPSAGSGGSFVWAEECRDSMVVVLGFFRVDVHGPAVLSLIGYPYHDDHTISIATCPNHVYESLPQSRCGWISIGGAALGTDTDGCNPMVEPCAPDVVPVQRTTWGDIKSRFGH